MRNLGPVCCTRCRPSVRRKDRAAVPAWASRRASLGVARSVQCTLRTTSHAAWLASGNLAGLLTRCLYEGVAGTGSTRAAAERRVCVCVRVCHIRLNCLNESGRAPPVPALPTAPLTAVPVRWPPPCGAGTLMTALLVFPLPSSGSRNYCGVSDGPSEEAPRGGAGGPV